MLLGLAVSQAGFLDDYFNRPRAVGFILLFCLFTLAHLNRDDTGPKQVKRMLMELDRRPQPPMPNRPSVSDPSKPSSVVSLALNALGFEDAPPPPSAALIPQAPAPSSPDKAVGDVDLIVVTINEWDFRSLPCW